MRFPVLASVSMLTLVGCVIREVPAGGTAPAPAATPAAPAAPAAPVATAAPAATPAAPGPVPTVSPAPTTAPTAGMAVAKPMLRAPEINKGNVFGGPKAAANTLKGEVFAIPDSSKGLPAFAQLTPFATIYTAAWDVAPRKFNEGFPGVQDRIEWFAIRWEGKITVKTAGTHSFKIKSDDGARLTIDGVQVVNNDGVHPPTELSGDTVLNAGEHNAVIEYFQGPKFEIALQIWVTPPKGNAKILTTAF